MLIPRSVAQRLVSSSCSMAPLLAFLGTFWLFTSVDPADAGGFRPLGNPDRETLPAYHFDASPGLRTLDCTSALPLGVGDVVVGDTTGHPDQVSQYGCAPYPETGGEIVYLLEITTPTRFQITIESQVDLDVILLASCDAQAGCLALGDLGVRTIEPASGSFYVVVDGYAGAAGAFTLRVEEETETTIPMSACESARHLRSYYLPYYHSDASTCGGPEILDNMLCNHSVPGGAERWYRLYLAEQATIEVSASGLDGADPAIWLLSECGDTASCLAYADQFSSGVMETLVWTNPDPDPRFVYVVVDTFGGPGDCGTFRIWIEAVVAVPAGGQTWSTWKAGFRHSGGAQ